MSDMIRLVYASRTTATVKPGIMDPAMGRILLQSRRNNHKTDVGGVLFFGDGFFFQCLEGERQAVESLYAKIRQDTRHSDARILLQQAIYESWFTNWSMKFVPAEDSVRAFLQRHGFESFTPFQFNESLVNELVSLFHQIQNSEDCHTESTTAEARKSGFLSRLLHGAH